VTDGSEVFLGVIAASTAVMALIQVGTLVGVLIYAARLVRRMESLLKQVQDEIRPVSANLSAVSRDAARAASLAAAQVERADRLFADLAVRVDETVTVVQGAIITPVREGAALMAGFRAAMAALRELRDARRRGVDEDDALFI
jgi:ABC-type Fe2+-enterobactin transport system substrate-binding protein